MTNLASYSSPPFSHPPDLTCQLMVVRGCLKTVQQGGHVQGGDSGLEAETTRYWPLDTRKGLLPPAELLSHGLPPPPALYGNLSLFQKITEKPSLVRGVSSPEDMEQNRFGLDGHSSTES